MLDAIVISDLHLGSNICQATSLIKFLESLETSLITKQLFINGDVFNCWNLARLKKLHWKVLGKIRALSNNIEIHWINGNHDGPAEIVSHLLGVDVVEERVLFSGDKKILLLHGDLFDKFITDHPILTWIGDTIYSLLQKIDPSFYMAKKAKLGSKTFLRCSEIVKNKAIDYAQKKQCNTVICGHTHFAMESLGPINYYNSGSWTEKPCHYITIQNGVIELKEFTSEFQQE